MKKYLLLLSAGLLISCGGGSSSGNSDSQKTIEKPSRSTPETTPEISLKLSELTTTDRVYISSSLGKSYLNLNLKSSALVNYHIADQHHLPRSQVKLTEKTAQLQAGQHAIELPASDLPVRRLYFSLENDNQLKTPVHSLVMPQAQSQARSYLNRWLCPTSKAIQSLVTPSFVIDVQQSEAQQHIFTLVINPEWYCDRINGSQRDNSHDYLQHMNVDVRLRYAHNNAVHLDNFLLTLASPSHSYTFPDDLRVSEMSYSVRSRYRQINTPTIVFPKRVIELKAGAAL